MKTINMGSASKYLAIGLIAACILQQSVAHDGSGESLGSGEQSGPGPTTTQSPVGTSPSPGPQDCSKLPDGTTIPSEVGASFFLCKNNHAIPMFCPLGLYPCFNGQYVLCTKDCSGGDSTSDCDSSTGTGGPVSTTGGSESTTGGFDSTTGGATTPTTLQTTTPIITTQATLPTTTPAPPSLETVCDWHGGGKIFAIANDCSAFGVCIFGKPVITWCLGKRQFDPVRGTCTTKKCR